MRDKYIDGKNYGKDPHCRDDHEMSKFRPPPWEHCMEDIRPVVEHEHDDPVPGPPGDFCKNDPEYSK